jgi:hypothetical protein
LKVPPFTVSAPVESSEAPLLNCSSSPPLLMVVPPL